MDHSSDTVEPFEVGRLALRIVAAANTVVTLDILRHVAMANPGSTHLAPAVHVQMVHQRQHVYLVYLNPNCYLS